MSRWTIRILGIAMLLILFLVMFQMLNTLKRIAERQERQYNRSVTSRRETHHPGLRRASRSRQT